jgi:hypothetical protein
MITAGKEAIAAVQQHDATDPYDIAFMDWRANRQCACGAHGFF